jgi:phenylacetate-CoA ligase
MTPGTEIFGVPNAVGEIVRHASTQVPFYKDSHWAFRLRNGHAITLLDIPLTLKSDVQKNPMAFVALQTPGHVGFAEEDSTSGSTGVSMPVFRDNRQVRINDAENARLRAPWQMARHRCVVTMLVPMADAPQGTYISPAKSSAIQHHMLHTRSASALKALIMEHRPTKISTRPSVALAMLESWKDLRFLELISTNQESVSDELRALVKKLPNCRILDNYGSEECGLIAMSCADCGDYHLAHANVHTELLNNAEVPCGPGATGRVVVTNISNYTMPLLRYDIRDFAIASRNNSCRFAMGLGFEKIIGRERIMLRTADGERIMPTIGTTTLMKLGIYRYKIVQTQLATIEVRYEPYDIHHIVDDVQLQLAVDTNVSPKFKAVAVKVSEFPLAPSGKYLMHECLI